MTTNYDDILKKLDNKLDILEIEEQDILLKELTILRQKYLKYLKKIFKIKIIYINIHHSNGEYQVIEKK